MRAKVIHKRNLEKPDKIELYTKLSTLSTEKRDKLVGLHRKIVNECFVNKS